MNGQERPSQRASTAQGEHTPASNRLKQIEFAARRPTRGQSEGTKDAGKRQKKVVIYDVPGDNENATFEKSSDGVNKETLSLLICCASREFISCSKGKEDTYVPSVCVCRAHLSMPKCSPRGRVRKPQEWPNTELVIFCQRSTKAQRTSKTVCKRTSTGAMGVGSLNDEGDGSGKSLRSAGKSLRLWARAIHDADA